MTKMVKDLADEVCDGRLVLTLEGRLLLYYSMLKCETQLPIYFRRIRIATFS